jgi:hypothetical protein
LPAAVIQAPPALEPERQPHSAQLHLAPPQRPVSKFLTRPLYFLPPLTLAALLLHGYHPYVDDSAIYVAGVEKASRPDLFAGHAEFVLPHLHHSILALLLGGVIRGTHLPVIWALWGAYILSLWLMLYASWRVAATIFSGLRERWGALLAITAALTMPVAGTAIFFTDAYLTARSFSTPATLLAVAFLLERRRRAATLCILLAIALHPLMGACGAGFLVALLLIQERRLGWLTAAALLVFASGAAAAHVYASRDVSQAYRTAAVSRVYFFLNHWTWFEIFGLIPPLLVAGLIVARPDLFSGGRLRNIAAASLYTGLVALGFALAFTRNESSFMLARLQPLREFHILYLLFFMILGAGLAHATFNRRRWWIGATVLGLTALSMLLTQHYAYPSLQHVEWPWVQPANPWEQAFLWIRKNAPGNAFFAIDPEYQSQPAEDTLGFRAMAERSVMADRSKDGGIAAIDPALARRWQQQTQATRGFSHWNDAERVSHLAPWGVTWILLPATATTHFACPYRNIAVMVCQLPQPAAR